MDKTLLIQKAMNARHKEWEIYERFDIDKVQVRADGVEWFLPRDYEPIREIMESIRSFRDFISNLSTYEPQSIDNFWKDIDEKVYSWITQERKKPLLQRIKAVFRKGEPTP